MDDAATLMTLLHRGKRPSSVGRLLAGWDMLQADVPSRERIETAASILVGSGLAEVDSSWGMRLTAEGGRLTKSVNGWQGMRLIPGMIRDLLAGRQLSRAPLTLPQALFDAARTITQRADAGLSGSASADRGIVGGGPSRSGSMPDRRRPAGG